MNDEERRLEQTIDVTVGIDSRDLEVAARNAGKHEISLDQAIENASRQALAKPTTMDPSYRNGVRLVRGGKRGATVTVEHVNALMDSLL